MIPAARALALALLTSLLLVSAAQAQVQTQKPAGPDPQPGLVITNDFDFKDSGVQAVDAGAKWVKFFVPAGTPDPTLAEYNRIFTQYKQVGVKVVAVLYGGEKEQDPTTFAAFARKAAGVFKDSAYGYMVWNEADGDVFWKPTPNAAAYVELLRRTTPVIRAVDPDAVISFTPLTGGNFPFLEEAYKLGAKGLFDVIGVDTDTACDLDSPFDLFRTAEDNFRISRFVFLGYREVHNVMAANGDGAKKIWLEMGWSSSTAQCNQGAFENKKPGGVSEAAQARHLREAYHCMREDNPSYVETAFWFDLKESPGADAVDNRFGLIRSDGTRKPSYAAYEDFAAGRDTLTGPCGDLTGPDITIKSPAPGQKVVDNEALTISAAAIDPRGLSRIQFSFNGENIGAFDSAQSEGKTVSREWFGSRSLPPGKHTIVVTALDKNSNPSTQTVEFEKISLAVANSGAKPAFKLGKLRCGKGRVCSIKGTFSGYAGLTFKNRIRVEWQLKGKNGKYKRFHKAGANAGKPFTFKQKLAKQGSWRLRMYFEARVPFKAVNAKTISFKVK